MNTGVLRASGASVGMKRRAVLWRLLCSRFGKVRVVFLEKESPEMPPELMNRNSSGTGMCVWGSH